MNRENTAGTAAVPQRPVLATGRSAAHPYEVRLIGRKVYSVEELCYSLEQCASFLDDGIMEEALLQWLEEECGLQELAAQLRPLLRDPSQTEEFVLRILAYVGFLSPHKIRKVRDTMESGKGMEPFRRRFEEARLAALQGRRAAAGQILDGLLADLPALERAMRAAVWAMKGKLCAEDFRFGEAAACCREAFALSGTGQDRLRFLFAQRMALGEEGFGHFVEENPDFSEAAQALGEQLEAVLKEQRSAGNARQIQRLRRNLRGAKNNAFDSAMEQFLAQEQDLYRAGNAPSF